MVVTDAVTLARAERAFLEAPAGCGKTHLIAEAVCLHGTRRELVLTHTHAGVDALRRKMQSIGPSPRGHVVDTIAGWTLRYASAFPNTCGLRNPIPKSKEEWDNVYDAGRDLLGRRPVRNILRNSYSGLYVDEYQDCTVQQHGLVVALADILPTRVLGDPLQGIFDFGKNVPVDWNQDVRGGFAELPCLTHPWRWEKGNLELGRWLTSVRAELLQGRPIDLRGAPVRWERLCGRESTVRQVGVCHEIARQKTCTVVAIHGIAERCHFVAKRLRGVYQCVEPIESRDLFQSGARIENSVGPARVVEVINFAARCMTRVGTGLQPVRDCYASGNPPRGGRGNLQGIHDVLRNVAEDDSPCAVLAALERIRSLPGAIMFRRELYNEMIQGLRGTREEGGSLADALWTARNRTRFAGRRFARCVVGTTLLIKGLEFEHAIVLDADEMDATNLYVALTRGCRSLTVFSRAPKITPKRSGGGTRHDR